MRWLRRLFRSNGTGRQDSTPSSIPPLDEEIEKTKLRMASALTFTLQMRDPELGISEHCALVCRVAGSIARQIGISEADAYILDVAARLHEVGMFTVPAELLRRPAPLSTAELEQVRVQARVSAEIAGTMHHPRAVWLIEHQYDDHLSLQRRSDIPARELLLAGIFRVADVFAAVTWPRPYQDPMPPEQRSAVLQSGAGTRFHPLAVHYALQIARQSTS